MNKIVQNAHGKNILQAANDIICIQNVKLHDIHKLIPCPDCNTYVSRYALSCPDCGFPVGQYFREIKESEKRKNDFIAVSILLFIMQCVALVMLYFILPDYLSVKYDILLFFFGVLVFGICYRSILYRNSNY